MDSGILMLKFVKKSDAVPPNMGLCIIIYLYSPHWAA